MAMSERPEISVVIPCYNEEENARPIYAAVARELSVHARSFEIIFIDNASTDATRSIIREICAEDDRVRAIFNTRNFGQMRSPTYAIYQAEGAAVIGMCADFQDPPALIGALIEQWRGGSEVVLGVRRSERAAWHITFIRRIGYEFLERNADYATIPGATGFGIYDRRVVDALAAWHEPEPFFRGMLVESGYRIATIQYDRPERAAGTTKNDMAALLDFAVSGIAGSSKRLLRKPITWSIGAGAGAIVLVIAALIAALLHGPGWPLLGIAVQLGLFSILFLFVGLIGEQVRLLAERTRNVPLVLEAERINFPPEQKRPAERTYIRVASNR